MKIILITGTTGKIGKYLTIAFAKIGYHIIAHTHSCQIHYLNNINFKHKHQYKIFISNLTLKHERNMFIDTIKKQYNHIDIIINNAGIFYTNKFNKISNIEYDKIITLNMKTPFYIIQGLLPLLIHGNNPCIINIIDTTIDYPFSKHSHYFASKGGLLTLTKALANELSPYIRVNAIAPGIFHFPITYNKQQQNNLINKIPLKKIGNFHNIIQASIFLSSFALYTTGHILYIDGGRNNNI